MDRAKIFQLIEEERARQEDLHPLPKKIRGEAPEIKSLANFIVSNEFLAILAEEFGEVGSALQGEGDLKAELVQVASVCVRWLENLD